MYTNRFNRIYDRFMHLLNSLNPSKQLYDTVTKFFEHVKYIRDATYNNRFVNC
jgi:hypothetical protein